MPLGVKIVRDKKNKKLVINSSIKFGDVKTFIDWICELKNITLYPNDTLTIAWNVNVFLSVDGKIEDIQPLEIIKVFNAKKMIVVNFARLVHYQNKSRIYVYESMPKCGFPKGENKI